MSQKISITRIENIELKWRNGELWTRTSNYCGPVKNMPGGNELVLIVKDEKR